MSVWSIVALIVGFICVAIVTIVMIKATGDIKKADVRANSPQITIHSKTIRAFTEGYYRGFVKSQLPRKNNTTLIEFYPDDIEQGEDIPKPDMKSFVVNNSFIIRYPVGELSARREQIEILPRSRSDLPDEMRKTLEGNYLEAKGQLAYIKETFGSMIPEGDKAITEGMKHYARGNVPKKVMEQKDAIIDKLSRMSMGNQQQNPSDDKKSS